VILEDLTWQSCWVTIFSANPNGGQRYEIILTEFKVGNLRYVIPGGHQLTNGEFPRIIAFFNHVTSRMFHVFHPGFEGLKLGVDFFLSIYILLISIS